MNKYIIQGGHPLSGVVTVSGAKNAAVAILPAALLVNGTCRIENVPDISDVRLLLEILDSMGAKIRRLSPNTLELCCTNVRDSEASDALVRRIRASYYFIGAQLGRFGHARVALPGGCNFGARPIDQHIKGFEAIGAAVDLKDGFVCAAAPADGLTGGRVNLDVVSVGATMNIMIGAVLANGTTVIENAAKEPHIVDLANFLNAMGATSSKFAASAACTAATTPSFRTKSRRAPIWRPSRPRAATCLSRTSSPNIWTASPPNCVRWA